MTTPNTPTATKPTYNEQGFEVSVDYRGTRIEGFVSREKLNEAFRKAKQKYERV